MQLFRILLIKMCRLLSQFRQLFKFSSRWKVLKVIFWLAIFKVVYGKKFLVETPTYNSRNNFVHAITYKLHLGCTGMRTRHRALSSWKRKRKMTTVDERKNRAINDNDYAYTQSENRQEFSRFFVFFLFFPLIIITIIMILMTPCFANKREGSSIFFGQLFYCVDVT